jgi:hypothetical protein
MATTDLTGLTKPVAEPHTATDTDQRLGSLLAGPNPNSIEAVLAHMDAIDAALVPNDGLRWFNRLYRMVTQQVRNTPPESPGQNPASENPQGQNSWENPAWLDQLDVVFAGFYFDALRTWTANQAIPSAWKAFFAVRFATGIDRIQFAVAGMNAHINHDLALALLKTDAELAVVPGYGSPEWRDYQAVNTMLNTVMPEALTMLAGDVLGELAQDTGKVGRLLAFWNICRARDLAWDFAGNLRALTGPAYDTALAVQDGLTGALGRAILAQI